MSNDNIQSDIQSLNWVTRQVYNDRIERGFTHEQAMAGALEYDWILRGETTDQ